MEKVEYPKFKYHPEMDPVIVDSKEDENELGKGWFDSPADVQKVKSEPVEKKAKYKKSSEGVDE